MENNTRQHKKSVFCHYDVSICVLLYHLSVYISALTHYNSHLNHNVECSR